MKLHAAMTLAEAIQRELAPFCQKCDIAGSIRRGRPEVNDIDFVVLVKGGQEQALRERCKIRSEAICDGPKLMSFKLTPKTTRHQLIAEHGAVRVDVYFARPDSADLLDHTPTNHGAILLMRTGSREHNIKLAAIAKRQDKALKAGEGIYAGGMWELEGQESVYQGGTLIASETEEKIFEALGIPWVPPALREVDFNPGPTVSEILNQSAAVTDSPLHNASQPASEP